MNTFLEILAFVFAVSAKTFMQLISIVGIIFLLSIILNLLERFNTKNMVKTFGWKGVLFTAWLGTPVHEFGHAFFCFPFRHKIVEVQFYEPDPDSGCLGYVSHTYNPKSLYQQIGNFFIGVGPLVMGSIALFASLILLPNNSQIFTIIEQHTEAFSELSGVVTNLYILWVSTISILEALLNPENLTSIQFWIFFYVALCIASHMSPSSSDMKGVTKGAVVMIFILLLSNGIAMGMGEDISGFVLAINDYTGLLVALLTFSVAISLANALVLFIVLTSFRVTFSRVR